MGLDHGGRPADGYRFDNVGIEGPLNQKARVPKLTGGFLKNTDEFLSHDLALFFRVLDAGPVPRISGKPSQQSLAGVNAQYFHVQALTEVGENRLEFVLPQK